MLLLVDETTVINVKEFISLMISNRTKKVSKKVSGGFFSPGKTIEVEENDGFALKLEYVDNQDRNMLFTSSGYNYANLQEQATRVVKQLREKDLINAAFEEAFLKDK